MYFECRHIMPNGARCDSPALRDKNYCYFHTRLHSPAKPAPAASKSDPAAAEPRKIPVLEDRSAILVALSQIVNDLNSKRLDTQRAGHLLYALQIASQNVERKQDVLPFRAVESVSLSRDGNELAPKLRVCDPPDDCPSCDDRENCKDYQPAEDSEES